MSTEVEATAAGALRPGLRRIAPLWVVLILAGGLAWAWTVAQRFDMGNGAGTMGMSFAFFLGMWTVMMAAMMLPALGPVAVTDTGDRPAAPLALIPDGLAFGAGFLLPWAAYGLAAFSAFKGADRLVESSPDAATWLGVGILAVAGAYQLSPPKWAALRHCRMPMHSNRAGGLAGSFSSGVLDGATCVGCCWALMTVFVAMGVMNLPVMAGLATLIFSEKVLPRPRLISAIGGVALLGLAVAAAVHPSLLSGLHTAGMGMEMMDGM